MTTQYTSILKLALPVQGELSGTWGDTVNDNITSMVEEAIAGRSVINSWTANSHTLTTANGTTSESRCAMLEFTDTGAALSGNATVICPTASKIYIAKNAVGSSRTVTLKTSAGTGIAIPDGTTMFLFCDGTNVVEAVTNMNSFNVGGTVTIVAIKDEDNMASDSATALATQQSIKAYVDSQIAATNELSEVLAAGNTSGGTAIQMTTTDEVQFRDTALKISSSADGQLDIDADVELEITAPTVDIDASTAVLVSNDLKLDSDDAVLGFGADNDVTLTHIPDTALRVNDAIAVQFRDAALSINSSTDGQLDIDADTEIEITAPTVDIDASTEVNISGATKIGGTLSVDAISEYTATAGVDIDGILLKDTSVGTDPASGTDQTGTAVTVKGGQGTGTGAGGSLIFQTAPAGTTGSTPNAQVTALTIDSAGDATFAADVNVTGALNLTGAIDVTDLEVTNIKAKDGTASASIADSTGVMTIASSVLTTTDINGGSIDGTNIGASSAGTGAFTTLNTTGVVNFDGVNSVQLRRNSIPGGFGTGSNLLDWQLVTTGSTYVTGARIQGLSDGAWSATSAPMYLSFGTVPASSVTLSERLRIRADGGIQYFADTGTEFAINDSSSDSDFRVESNSNTHMLFLDASSEKVAIGSTGVSSSIFSVADTTSTVTWASASATTAGTVLGTQGTSGGSLFINTDSVNSNYASGLGFEGSFTSIYSTLKIRALGVRDPGYESLLAFYTTQASTEYERLILKKDEAVFNDGGYDTDFRVESDANTHALFVNAGTSRVGINQSAPGNALHVNSGTASDITTFGNDAGSYVFGYTSNLASWDLGASDSLRIRHGSTETVRLKTTESVFNELGADLDFRVESDTSTHALFVDASADNVGILTGSPNSSYALTIGGSLEGLYVSDDAALNKITSTLGYSVSSAGANTTFRLGNLAGQGARALFRFVGSVGYGDPNMGVYFIECALGNADDEVRANVWRQGYPGTFNGFQASNGEFLVYTDKQASTDFDFWIKLGHFVKGDFFVEAVQDATVYFDNSGSATIPGTAVITNTTSNPSFLGEKLDIFSQNSAQTDLRENVEFTYDATVFNQDSYDQDFRVESNGNTHMLFVDAGSNAVTVNTGTPRAVFTIKSTGNSYADGSIGLEEASTTSTVYLTNAGGNFYISRTGSSDDMVINTGAVVFNESSADLDFRVESDSNANMLFVEAGTDRVAIGHNNPGAKLDIMGQGTSAANLSMLIGADEGATVNPVRTDGTDKAARIGIPHKTNAEEPFALVVASSTSGSNALTFGGGTSVMNAATEIYFATAANATTTSGTTRVRILSDGTTVFSGDVTYSSNGPTYRGQIILADSGGSESDAGGIEYHTSSGGGAGYGVRTIAGGGLTPEFYTQTRTNSAAWTRITRVSGTGFGISNDTLTATSHLGLSINTSGTAFQRFTQTNNEAMSYDNYSGSGYYQVDFRWNNSEVGAIQVTSTATAYNTSSDYRLKENVVDITDAIDTVKQLKPKQYNFIADPDVVETGFIAHEVKEILDHVVSGEKDATLRVGDITDADGNLIKESVREPDTLEEGQTWTYVQTVGQYQKMDYARLTPILTAALKEAVAKIEALEARVASLENP